MTPMRSRDFSLRHRPSTCSRGGGQRPDLDDRSDDREAAHRHLLARRPPARCRRDPIQTCSTSTTPRREAASQYPTWRLDYNLTTNNRISYTSYFQKYESYPDTLNNAEPRFPGFPVAGGQNSNRWNWNIQARSTIGKNLVNQFVTGYTASHVFFFTEITPQVLGRSVGEQAGSR
jgi:hypothetical protein